MLPHPSLALHLLATGLIAAAALPAQVQWTQRPAMSGQGCPMAFDAARGRAVVFSGLGETYLFDGGSWTLTAPATSPSSRCGHALAFDSVRQRIVFFGGHNEYPPYQDYGDTWEWDGGNWIRRTPTTAPTARWGYGMVYDSKRSRCVLFGGSDSTANLNDTWEWDGTNWQQRNPTNRPPARWFHGMSYDTARGVTVLFGGTTGTTVFADTWEYDGTDWTQRAPAASPPGRFAPGMAYDSLRQRSVIFGGDPVQKGNPCRDDTWEWDGTTWTQRTPSTVPAARYRPGLVYSTTAGRLVMHSGNTGTPDFAGLTDTWSFDGNNWTRLTPHQVPVRGAAAYDPVRRRTVLHGGYMAATAQLSETWEWDGGVWRQRTPATSPPARARSAVAYDTLRSRLVMFGGTTGPSLPTDTWEWDGNNWAQASTTTSPPGRTGHALAYDAARGRTVLQAGIGLLGPMFDTWEWDGTQWTQRAIATRPTSFAGHAMTYDSDRQRVVLFGGFDLQANLLAETWEWDGTVWLRRQPAQSPPARFDHAMAYDVARQRVVLYGGFAKTGEHYDTWEWDGTAWTKRDSLRMPRPLTGLTMAYDTDLEVIVLFGNHTWTYAATHQARTELYGVGCRGSAGVPALAPVGRSRPWLGDTFTVGLTSVPSPTAAVCWLGASRTTWGPLPLPLDLTPVGMPGCALRASADVLLAMAPNGQLPLPIPVAPALAGLTLYQQAFVFDPPVNRLGLTSSNGVAAVIGAR